MPFFCGIDIRLVSQPENVAFPEYISSSTPEKEAIENEKYPTISTCLSITKKTQFWIVYSVPSPCPLSSYYYFKATFAGKIVLSWGCGARDGFQGKIMFTLVNGGDRWMGENSMEKKTFFFNDFDKPCSLPETTLMTIAVYRAQGRKRVSREKTDFQESSAELCNVADIE